VDAGEALDELTRLSTEVDHAVILERSGTPLAVTAGTDADRLASAAVELLGVAAAVDEARTVEKVVVKLATGSVFVVRDREHIAAAATGPEPTEALVVHDLRTCLERIGSASDAASPEPGLRATPVDA
jgi:predicted regulator of Ras-like GTPase activity (Roadblock/LC7/MglB family)